MKLSVVIVEYHSIDELESCLAALAEPLDKLEHEIIVSSNSEYDAQKQTLLIKQFSTIRWQFNSGNLGFAGGVNQGLKRATGDAILHLNTDALLREGFTKAVRYLIDNRDVAILGPEIRDPTGVLQDSCREFMTPSRALRRLKGRLLGKRDVLLQDDFDYERAQDVDWVIGGAFLVNRSAVQDVGLLDEKYFMYVEDMDWCLRFWKCGYRVQYYPMWKVEYKGDRKSVSPLIASGGLNKHTRYHAASYLRFLAKHFGKYSRSQMTR
jgi:GT2 family glycosyltransferase